MAAETLQVAAYVPRSQANGPGLRSVLWVQGCPFRCPGCFNPDFWPFIGGQSATVEELVERFLAEPNTEGISLSGGEPFAQAAALARVAEGVRASGKGVLVFTGFPATLLQTSDKPGVRRLLAAADLLVTGPYDRDRPCARPLLASANQELVYLTERYRGQNLGPRRVEYHISANGVVTKTGFPKQPMARRMGKIEQGPSPTLHTI